MGILLVGKFPKPSWKIERGAEKESEAIRHDQAECRQYLAAGKTVGTGKRSGEIMRTIQTAGKVAKKRNSFRYISNRLSLHFAKKYKIFADK
ncbi:MAG: hypothetical protein HDR01_11830 [Lachnospiraceae bacterium]|nr:hypothetical protein [Lachnospiraceae bacterium]